MSRTVLRALARLLSPWRTIRRLEADRQRLYDLIKNPELTGMQIGRETGLSAGMRGSGPQLLAGMFLGLMEENKYSAPNFMELSFQTSQGPILVTVTQPKGATPGNLLGQAKQRVRELEAELLRLQGDPEAHF